MLALMLLTVCGVDEKVEPTPAFSTQLRKSEDKFEVKVNKSAVVWAITSKSGIGGAEVKLKSGPAPEKITIRFVGLKNLESFSMRDGLIRLSTSLDREKGRRILYFDDKGLLTVNEKESTGSLKVDRTEDGIEVVLTSRKPGKEWKFSWIDAFRR